MNSIRRVMTTVVASAFLALGTVTLAAPAQAADPPPADPIGDIFGAQPSFDSGSSLVGGLNFNS
ncbi:hypothetical protein ACIBCO_39675 [Streptomyces violascens]|uniref:hypothetical protein n=1 Tax=Streptomyces violascens TaxID=67381 RepID=UPI0037931F93